MVSASLAGDPCEVGLVEASEPLAPAAAVSALSCQCFQTFTGRRRPCRAASGRSDSAFPVHACPSVPPVDHPTQGGGLRHATRYGVIEAVGD
eukprot:855691-Pyramimonas_sp.AAC.1